MAGDHGPLPDDVIGGGSYMPASAVPRLYTAQSPLPMSNTGGFSINSSRSMPEKDDLRRSSISRGGRQDVRAPPIRSLPASRPGVPPAARRLLPNGFFPRYILSF